jgi:hypothetical protein
MRKEKELKDELIDLNKYLLLVEGTGEVEWVVKGKIDALQWMLGGEQKL